MVGNGRLPTFAQLMSSLVPPPRSSCLAFGPGPATNFPSEPEIQLPPISQTFC